MTHRERLLTILEGGLPDQVPWVPRLKIWHTAQKSAGTLPERYRDWSLRDIEEDLGMGTPAREGRIFTSRYEGVNILTRQAGEFDTVTEYETPVGSVSTLMRGSPMIEGKGMRALDIEHMIKGPDDYEVVEYLFEHTDYTPTYEAYLEYEQEIGDDGLPLVACGDCPFHFWLKDLVGYNDGYYHLNDYAEKVEHLLEVMTQKDRECLWPLMGDSPARLLLHGVHFDSNMTPPPIFDRYIRPYYEELSAFLHSRGKKLCMHADADSRLILDHIRESGFDMAETFTTEPMVSCTLAEAREAFGEKVILWGAVPSIILEDTFSDAYFEAYMENVFRTIAPGRAFILGVADNVMPPARLDRLQRISQMVEEHKL